MSRAYAPSCVGAVVLAALAGCATRPPAPAACAPPAQTMLEAELLFGLSMPGGGTVSPAAFDAFVATALTPRFPAGLTVLPGRGQWRGPDGRMVAEGARVVILIAPDDPGTATRLQAVRRAYREQFHQRSVGLITVASCAGF